MMYRRYRVPPAWREMDRLQREMNRLFEDYSPARLRRAPGYPAMNVWVSDEGLVVTAEVPGVKPEDIDVNVVGDTLTLSGARKPDELDESSRYHRQERGYGNFTRSIQLPFPVNVSNVEAAFRNGVLNISLPRAEEDKPKKIAVKAA
ncbi:MAG: Hsp20/alpha crystallin family protein [Anaerolineales bacterium]|nr:Hsp20/alpha crystallin family protein [Anaerolineales bacterium]